MSRPARRNCSFTYVFGGDAGCERAARLKRWNQDLLGGIQNLRRLRHKTHAAEDDNVHRRRLSLRSRNRREVGNGVK